MYMIKYNQVTVCQILEAEEARKVHPTQALKFQVQHHPQI